MLVPPFVALALVLVTAVSAGAQTPLYEEDPAASDPGRAEQARELEAYTNALLNDRSALHAIFRPDYSSQAAYVRSTARLRKALMAAIGYPPPGKPDGSPMELKLAGEDAIGIYYRFRISVLPGVHAIGLYIVPKDRSRARRGKVPLVIAMHGGGGSPELALFHGGANYHDMIRGAVQRGYAVWAPQHLFGAVGQPANVRQIVDSRARLGGTTITAIEIAKITRGLDAILKRPELDRNRVGMIGLSYGGFYTLMTTAIEPRIKVAVSSSWFSALSSVLLPKEPYAWGDCRFLGGLSLFRDSEIAALICPRALEVQMGAKDDLFPIAGARKLAPEAAAYYQRLGVADRFRFVEFDGIHEFHGASAWEWLEQL